MNSVSAFEIYKQKKVPSRKNGIKKSYKTKKIKKILLPKESSEKKEKTRTKVRIDNTRVETIPDDVPPVNEANSDNCLMNNGFQLSDDPVEDVSKLFNWFIAPVDPNNFFKTYWEKKPLHIKRVTNSYYKQILNSENLDKIIRNNYLEFTKNVDVVSYVDGHKEVHNLVGKVSPSMLWDFYSNGCSIRILNPQTYCNKVHLLLSTLQEYFGNMVGANVYLTPPNSQGFAPHYDDIEAFVIQLEGRKHWKLYQPKSGDILARTSSSNLKHEDIGKPFMEITLNAGELLYFPRGTIHEAFADKMSHSLHLTVSVYQRTSFADILEIILPNALEKAAKDNIEFRKGLPLNHLKHFGLTTSKVSDRNRIRESMETKVKDLIKLLTNYIDVDTASDLMGKRFMYDSMPPVLTKSELKRCSKADGPYLKNGSVMNRVFIDMDTKIRLVRYYCIRLVQDESGPKLFYNTENARVYHGEEEQFLEMDSALFPLIQTLQESYPSYIKVKKLPLEDENLKLQCISDLWERGLIVTDEPLKSIL